MGVRREHNASTWTPRHTEPWKNSRRAGRHETKRPVADRGGTPCGRRPYPFMTAEFAVVNRRMAGASITRTRPRGQRNVPLSTIIRHSRAGGNPDAPVARIAIAHRDSRLRGNDGNSARRRRADCDTASSVRRVLTQRRRWTVHALLAYLSVTRRAACSRWASVSEAFDCFSASRRASISAT